MSIAYFSPTLSTKKTALKLAWGLGLKCPTNMICLTNPNTRAAQHSFSPSEMMILAAPVYDGRLPKISPGILENISGSGTPAVGVVSYGGRGYDDALLEMKDLLEMSGFAVLGAGAFVAAHSLSKVLAAGRPDQDDLKEILEFGRKIRQIIDDADASKLGMRTPISVPGNFPYREAPPSAVVPPRMDSADDDCAKCKLCYSWCPMRAIDFKDNKIIDDKKCILCNSCIKHCPKKIPIFADEAAISRITATEGMFADIRMDNEIFL